MRVRITQTLHGSIDGIQLSRFVAGLTYEVGTTLGNYLLAQNAAVPVDPETPALVSRYRDCSELSIPATANDDSPRLLRRKKKGKKR